MGSELYNRNQGNFIGEEIEVKSNGSIWKNNLQRFHGLDTETAKFKIGAQPSAQHQSTVNMKSSLYKKDEAAFHGTDKYEKESQNTEFQQNAAKFLGMDSVPQSGERIVKIEKGKKAEGQQQKTSYLNEQRLKEHVSDSILLKRETNPTLYCRR